MQITGFCVQCYTSGSNSTGRFKKTSLRQEARPVWTMHIWIFYCIDIPHSPRSSWPYNQTFREVGVSASLIQFRPQQWYREVVKLASFHLSYPLDVWLKKLVIWALSSAQYGDLQAKCWGCQTCVDSHQEEVEWQQYACRNNAGKNWA